MPSPPKPAEGLVAGCHCGEFAAPRVPLGCGAWCPSGAPWVPRDGCGALCLVPVPPRVHGTVVPGAGACRVPGGALRWVPVFLPADTAWHLPADQHRGDAPADTG